MHLNTASNRCKCMVHSKNKFNTFCTTRFLNFFEVPDRGDWYKRSLVLGHCVIIHDNYNTIFCNFIFKVTLKIQTVTDLNGCGMVADVDRRSSSRDESWGVSGCSITGDDWSCEAGDGSRSLGTAGAERGGVDTAGPALTSLTCIGTPIKECKT